MNLPDDIFLAIIDKLLIGVIMLIAAYWLNHRLETFKGALSFQTALAPERTAAYQMLWEKTEPLTPREVAELDVSTAKGSCFEDLRDWYYKNGNAMYLSLNAADLFLGGLKLLERTEASAEEIKDHFSSLRTQLKVDLGIYTKADAKVQIPRIS
ncbi:hypothetical protein [Kineobactrum salinum]|uniref:Uncharacterized protein n=1 Tax=Kineobactrum salinum TaxID=2708301 RepID=A0A6C0U5N6_9GAMM|nr:hypothetical protein [Kineobactrum salinum]QIB65715.1 hypothetical protein G3T16_10100 [Kineobactrum salinum]